MHKITFSVLGIGAAFLLAPAAQADITGTVDATITLEAGLSVVRTFGTTRGVD